MADLELVGLLLFAAAMIYITMQQKTIFLVIPTVFYLMFIALPILDGYGWHIKEIGARNDH